MGADVACEMPLDELEKREEALLEVTKERAVAMFQAMWRGKKGRKNLGVEKKASVSEKEAKAQSFKKKFANLMSNPSQVSSQGQKALPPPPKPAAPPADGSAKCRCKCSICRGPSDCRRKKCFQGEGSTESKSTCCQVSCPRGLTDRRSMRLYSSNL